MAFFLKSKLPDSVNRVGVSRCLYVFIMAMCIVYCHPLPLSTKLEEIPWWCQPCQQNEHKTRHSRAINEMLRDQFIIASVNYETKIKPYVSEIHKKIGNISKGQINKNKWLPKCGFYESLKKDNATSLPSVYHQVQVFSATIDRLSKMEIRSEDSSFDAEQRAVVLQFIKDDLNYLRCTTYDEIIEKRQTYVEKKTPKQIDRKIPSKVHHLTEGLVKDFSILENYSTFLTKTYAKLFGSKKNQKQKPCNQRKKKTAKKEKKVSDENRRKKIKKNRNVISAS